MLQLPFEQRAKSVQAFNERELKVKRDRNYVPLVIDELTETTSAEWMLYCLALSYVNRPTAQERRAGLETLKQKNQGLHDQIMPIILDIEMAHFGYSHSVA